MYPLRFCSIIIGTCSLAATAAVTAYILLLNLGDLPWGDDRILSLLLSALTVGLLIGFFICGPVLLSFYNIAYLICPHSCEIMRRRSQRMEIVSILFGGLCFWLTTGLDNTIWDADWWVQLFNAELHAPVATWTYPTLITVTSIGIIGYLVLYIARRRPLPPLMSALGLGGMYLGAAVCLILLLQLIKHSLLPCVYLVNLILIFLKVVKELVLQYNEPQSIEKAGLKWFSQLLHNGKRLPLLGLLIAIPLLGIVVGVLTLFGQAPDSFIQAWTQTSDWTFSQQIAPANLPMDMHYLCTVAAGGHRRLVKPLRIGKRHGHLVLVNRQLAVANAFEELLQERMPRFHRVVRGAYDRYGYPIAKHIRSPWVADAVWLIMKPAEWFFVGVLYLFDLKPENRIAVQYPHKPLPSKDQH